MRSSLDIGFVLHYYIHIFEYMKVNNRITRDYHRLFSLQADVYKSLANPKRLEIINCLRNYELTVTELKNMLGWRQANISQHLAVLRQLRLVQTRRNGVNIYYSLTDKNIIRAYDLVRELLFKNSSETPPFSLKDPFQITKDVVCSMHVSAFSASEQQLYRGKTYYFCGRGCLVKFQKYPRHYL